MEIVGRSYGKKEEPAVRVGSEQHRAGKEEIMRSLGIGESIRSQDVFIQQVQHKEKQATGETELTGGLIEQVEQRLRRIQVDNRDRQQVLLQKQEEQRLRDEEQLMQMHDQEDRVQQVEHVLSTLDRPTLENVERHLEEHRHRMAGIQEKYQQMQQSRGMGDTGDTLKRVTIQEHREQPNHSGIYYQFQESDLVLDTRPQHLYMGDSQDQSRHVDYSPPQRIDRQHQQLADQIAQQQQLNQFMDQRRLGQGFRKDDCIFSFERQEDQGLGLQSAELEDEIQTIRVKRKKRVNPWQDKPKVQKISQQQLRRERNEYKQRFHHYKTTRSKSKDSQHDKSKQSARERSLSQKERNSRSRSQSRSLSQKHSQYNRGPSQKHSRSLQRERSQSYKGSPEKSFNQSLNERESSQGYSRLASYNTQQLKRLFLNIDLDHTGFISKNSLLHLLSHNSSLRLTYCLPSEVLLRAVWNYPFENPHKLSFSEMQAFLAYSKEQNITSSNKQQTDKEVVESIFAEVDRHDDLIVDRKVLLERMFVHPMGRSLLDKGCRYLEGINRVVTYRKVLTQMLRQQEGKQETEFISCQQFLDSLQGGDLQVVTDVDQADSLILDEEVLMLLHKHFMALQSDGYVDLVQLVLNIRDDPQWEQVQGLVARQPKDITLYEDQKDYIRMENVAQVLIRMEEDVLQEGVGYLDYQEVLEYFSVLGRPAAIYSHQLKLHNQDVDMHQQEQSFNALVTDPMMHQRSRSQKSRESEENNEESEQNIDFQKIKSNYTIPVQFNMMRREQERPQSIHEQKFTQYMDELDTKHREEVDRPFRAKEVPDIVKEPLWDKIQQEQEDRRQKVKQNSVYMTVQNQKPFSFHEKQREKDQQNYLESRKRMENLERERQKKAPKKQMSRAEENKGVQWFVTKNVGEQQNYLDEAQRKERINQRAQEQLAMSKLPPRMEKHLKIKEITEMRNRTFKEKKEDSRSFRRKSVPDFRKEQLKFQMVLEQKKTNKRVTQVIPFNFEDKKTNKVSKLVQEETEAQRQKQVKKEDPLQRFKRMQLQQSLQEYPQNTKKWEKAMEKNRLKKEKQDEEAKKKKEEEQARIDKYKRFAPKVQQSKDLADNTQKLKRKREENIKENQMEMKKKARTFKQQMHEINQRVQNRPLLFETDYSQDKKLIEMKKVYLYVKSLQEGGLSKKRIEELLTQQQKDTYEDYLFLSKKGYKDIFKKLDKKNI